MVKDILRTTEEKMRASNQFLRRELASIRTGHATPALVEHIKVEYGGALMPLNQVASISAPEARLLVIQPWDRSIIRDIEKTILKSDLGLNPSNDGTMIRLAIPPLSEERRQELIKVVRRRVEEGKIAIRNVRRDAVEDLRKLEKSKEISQDEHKRADEQVQKLTDSFIMDADKIGREKEAQLLEV
ncbi:MAG: ribosome recycling factor [Chloroflexi bacterium]|nr:ribosome recycling factor [Chloroflexota bacterium]